MKLFRTLDEKLAAQSERTGLKWSVRWSMDELKWEAKIEGASRYMVRPSERSGKVYVLNRMRGLPSAEEMRARS